MELLEPAAQRASTDLFVLTHGRARHATTKREFYEVTFVQLLFQYMLMSPALRDFDIRWEVPFGPGGQNPKRVDLVLQPDPTSKAPRLLLEVGRFSVRKLKEDSAKLRNLDENGATAEGLKRVLLYWMGADAPATPKEARDAIRKPMENAASRRQIGAAHIKPRWISGSHLFSQGESSAMQFSAVLVEVLA